MKRSTWLLGAGILSLCSAAHAAVPGLLGTQGVLRDGSGNPVQDSSYAVTFRIYNAPSGGAVYWSETQSVTTQTGLFTVELGSSSPLPDSVFSDTALWLGVQVSADPELTPRQRLVSTAYSQRVAHFVPVHGGSNTFVGRDAGNLAMVGGGNTACGTEALRSNTAGERNLALGTATLFSNTTGSYNTACGNGSLQNNSMGHFNTASGAQALIGNDEGSNNTASGTFALFGNTMGNGNTAMGYSALSTNTTGSNNTALGNRSDVSVDALTNATAIGHHAIVDASNKIRLGDSAVTVIEGQVAYTFTSDKSQKENFQLVNGEDVLRKLRGFELSSWNYRGHDPKQFRHYGPMAQDFHAAFGEDGVGKIGTETTLNSGDVAGILMVAVQALEKRTAEVSELVARMEDLEKELSMLRAERERADAK